MAGSYSDEIYSGVKSFAIKGTLLPRNTLETLVESKSLEELVNRLKGTPYADAVSKLQPPFSARKIELALRERLVDVHYKLMRTAPSYDLLQLYYLRYIAWNLKSALKSKALNKSFEESMQYIDLHAEELLGRRELIIKVLSAKDIQEATAFLKGTEFGEDVVKATATFARNGEVRVFDVFVDHTLLQRLATAYSSRSGSSIQEDVDQMVTDMVALSIDAYNVLTLLRAKLWNLSSAETNSLIVIPTFSIPLSLLQKIALAESVSEGVALLSGTRHAISAQSGESGEVLIGRLEEKFDELNYQATIKAFLWQGFGPGAILAVIKLTEFEVRNLAAIAFGVEAGMPARNILAGLRL